MTKRRVWRYKCDYCRKSGCSGPHIVRHERGCTMNPKRECGLCRIAGVRQPSLATLIAVVEQGGESMIADLEEAAEACPICMLAALRQAPSSPLPTLQWAYKQALQAWWTTHNDAQEEAAMRELYPGGPYVL